MAMADRLQRLRTAHGESVRQAAERCGISHPTWSRLERGESEGDDETLSKIAGGYGVTVDYIRWGRDLRTEFAEYLRSLPASRRGALLVDSKGRLQTTLRFLQSRAGHGHGVVEAAGLTRKDLAKAAADVKSIKDHHVEPLIDAVQRATQGAISSDWIRQGVEELEQVNRVVASSLAEIGEAFHKK